MIKYNDFENGDKELINNLLKGKMLVEDSLDENAYIIAQNNISRFSNNVFGLTIAPTMDCNFCCPYCYEKNKNYASMSKETIESVHKFFEELKCNYKHLSVTWYGGEPLMAFDTISILTEKAFDLFNENFSASIVTNGYLMNENVVSKFDLLKINYVQVTIDGPPEIHNSRRRLIDGNDSFFVIMENIKNALDILPQLKIVIRVNADKENIDKVDDILIYLKEYQIDKKVELYLAPVDNINNVCSGVQCFTNKEFANEQLDFIERNIQKGYNFFFLPKAAFSICGAVSFSSLVLDPVGNLYKCWDDIGNKDECIGCIGEEKRYNNNLAKWLSYSLINDKECMACAFLPVCMGGCPNARIKEHRKKCIPLKNNVEGLMNILYLKSKK